MAETEHSTGPAPTRSRPKHLLDPDNLAASHRATQGSRAALTHVQRWVLSVLVVTTILHLSVGLALAGATVDADARVAGIGLNILAGLLGIASVAIGLAIHGRRLLSPWLLLGTLPALVGLWFTLNG